MGWEPQVQRKTANGRRPWYTLEVQGHRHHLGTDRAQAYVRAAEILGGAATSGQPGTVQGLVLAYTLETGTKPQGAMRFGEWAADKRLVELEPADLQRFADWLKGQKTRPRPHTPPKDGEKPKKPAPPRPLSAWSIRHYVADARKVWQWGASKGWPLPEPGKVNTPRPLIHPRDEQPEVISAALLKLNPRAAAIAEFIATTGCRPSEARRLEWDHLDLRHSTATLAGKVSGRTGRPRTLHLPPRAVELVIEQPKISAHVFNTRLKKPWTKDGLHTVLERAGIRSTYSLRHTFAQWFLDHGGPGGKPGDKAELQEWLGHADGRMTDVYAQVRSGRLRKVARRIKGPLGT